MKRLVWRAIWIKIIVIAGLLAGCASLPKQPPPRMESTAFDDISDTSLARAIMPRLAAHPGQDGFVLLPDGLDAFVARAILARHAERSIDVQYYLYHHDTVGALFTSLLLEAAERGVRVRILVDDMDMGGRDEPVMALDTHPNIEIRFFNPFSRRGWRGLQFLTGFGTLTRRMHNKSFIVDNTVAILGGRNIGDEYFAADPALSFADLDVLAVGAVVPEVSRAFDLYWNSAQAWAARDVISVRPTEQRRQELSEMLAQRTGSEKAARYLDALESSELARALREHRVPFYWGKATLVVDDPAKISHKRDARELHLIGSLASYFEDIKDELIVISPYFVPGKEGMEFFSRLAARGVRVRILTNSLASNDVGVVHAGYMRYRRELLRAGVELYELNKALSREERKEVKGLGGSSKASLHAKTFVIDRRRTFIGSLNLDPRSLYENTEIGLVIDAPEMAEHMAERFDKEIGLTAFRVKLEKSRHGEEQLRWYGVENGKPVIYDVDPHTGFWRRFGIGLLMLLPLESQL